MQQQRRANANRITRHCRHHGLRAFRQRRQHFPRGGGDFGLLFPARPEIRNIIA